MKFTKNKVFLMLVAGALALGIAGGTILAATASTASAQENGAGQGQSFAARVAEKLTAALGLEQDITEAQVQEAFDGAATDHQEEKLQARLDEMEVEEATATAIMDWFQAYPYTDLVKLRYIGLASSEKAEGVLERLVEKERITQAQSDGIQSWYDDRPELPEGLERSGRRGWHGGEERGGHHGGRHQDKDGSENDDNGGDDGDGGTGTRFNGRRFHRGGPGRGNSI